MHFLDLVSLTHDVNLDDNPGARGAARARLEKMGVVFDIPTAQNSSVVAERDALREEVARLTAAFQAPKRLTSDQVEWVVNDLGELGVKIGNQFFFLYKGYSLVYGQYNADPTIPVVHERGNSKAGYAAGDVFKWRPVGKREFGECCHPLNPDDPTKIGTVSLYDSDAWQPLPAAVTE